MKGLQLFLLAAFVCSEVVAQSNKYAKEPIDFKTTPNSKFHIISRNNFTHVWIYHPKELALYVYDQNLKQVSKQSFQRDKIQDNVLFSSLSFNTYYYAIVLLKNSPGILKIADDGAVQTTTEHLEKMPLIKTQIFRHGNKIFTVEIASLTQQDVVFSISQFDSTLKLLAKQNLKVNQIIDFNSQIDFLPFNDSSLIVGHISTNNPFSSTLTITKLNLYSGQLVEKKSIFYDQKFTNVKFLKDSTQNLFVKHNVHAFQNDSSVSSNRNATYVTRINKEWISDHTLSFETDTSLSISKGIITTNQYLHYLGGKVVLINFSTNFYSLLINSALNKASSSEGTSTVDDPNKFSQPHFQELNSRSAKNSVDPRHQALTDPDFEERMAQNDIFRNLPSRKTSGTSADMFKLAASSINVQELISIDTSLTRFVASRIRNLKSSKLYQTADKLVAFSGQQHYINRYALDYENGSHRFRDMPLNPLYHYLFDKITPVDEYTVIVPYLHKKHLYFVKAHFDH